jgi:hypothetical protein
MQQLNWNVFPPTAFYFANYMICMLPSEVKRSTTYIIRELVKYMTELAICVYSFVKHKPSSKAFACMLVACESLDDEDRVPDDARRIFVSEVCAGVCLVRTSHCTLVLTILILTTTDITK